MTAAGLTFGLPAEWEEAPVPAERDEADWAGFREWRIDGTPVAEAGVITGFETPQDAGELAFQSLSLIRFETQGEPAERTEIDVPGSPDAVRGDYTYDFQGEEFDTVRGVDVAVMLGEGDGAVLRVTGAGEHLDDDLVERIVGTVHVP